MDRIASLAEYRLLGRSGLRVSPITLGTGSFGEVWGAGWSMEESAAREVFNAYCDAGGNSIDTADGYQGGQSEEWLGKFLRERGKRDRLVIATKFSFGTHPGDPNGGGNGRKHLLETCESSLRRLGTDYIDLYWLHSWDGLTPAEEVMATLHALVQQGKVRYVGFSNTPAWYLGRAQTLAELRGWEKVCALQLEYSLVTREIEREFIPAAHELGLAICPWSPLANGVLTGKYHKNEAGVIAGEGRLTEAKWTTGVNSDLRERNQKIVAQVLEVAREARVTPAQVALQWVTQRPRVASTIIGVRKLSQLDDNLRALEKPLDPAHAARLDAVSALGPQYPYNFFEGGTRESVLSGAKIRTV